MTGAGAAPSRGRPVSDGGDELVGDMAEQARQVFGSRLDVAVEYAALLADEGVAHGHIGPGEVPRLWSRHLLNCARVADLLPAEARIVDVGSGAGLPALPMAIRRPDLAIVALEPMQRRVAFLERAATQLGLTGISVLRGRAEDPAVRGELGELEWVTARAVAPLDRLVRWCLPLLRPGGRLLAMKGRGAVAEIEQASAELVRSGGRVAERRAFGSESDETWVVTVERAQPRNKPRQAGAGRRRRG